MAKKKSGRRNIAGGAKAGKKAKTGGAGAEPTSIPNGYRLTDAELEEALLTGQHVELLESYFGEAAYQELVQLASRAKRRGPAGGPRVLILPGIMGSKLGRSRLVFDEYSNLALGVYFIEEFFTDYYYADLSEWDSNGDRIYAEDGIDSPSYRPDLAVARIPVSTVVEAERYIDKLEEEGGKNLPKKKAQISLHLSPFFKDQRLDAISTFTVGRYKKARRDQGARDEDPRDHSANEERGDGRLGDVSHDDHDDARRNDRADRTTGGSEPVNQSTLDDDCIERCSWCDWRVSRCLPRRLAGHCPGRSDRIVGRCAVLVDLSVFRPRRMGQVPFAASTAKPVARIAGSESLR